MRRGIYGASRTARAGLWRGLRNSGYPIISSWIDVEVVTDRGALLTRAFEEAANAERLIWLVEPEDFPFKIAWGEVCVALHAGVPVYIVVPRIVTDDQLGGLPSHRLVRRVELSMALFGTRPQ